MITEKVELAETNYIANAGVKSRQGFQAYKRYISDLSTKMYRESNNIKQATIWEKIKKVKDK